MTHRYHSIALIPVFLLSLNGCQPEGATPAKEQATTAPTITAPTTTAPTSTTPTTIASKEQPPTTPSLLSLEPASMTNCGPAEVLAKWDVRPSHPDVTAIEIWVGTATNNKVWIASTPYGEAKTGPWAGPGSLFVLKNQATGEEISRAVIQGPTCP